MGHHQVAQAPTPLDRDVGNCLLHPLWPLCSPGWGTASTCPCTHQTALPYCYGWTYMPPFSWLRYTGYQTLCVFVPALVSQPLRSPRLHTVRATSCCKSGLQEILILVGESLQVHTPDYHQGFMYAEHVLLHGLLFQQISYMDLIIVSTSLTSPNALSMCCSSSVRVRSSPPSKECTQHPG